MKKPTSLYMAFLKAIVCILAFALLAMLCIGIFVPRATRHRITYQMKAREKGQFEEIRSQGSVAYDSTATLEKLLEAIKPLAADPVLGETCSDILAKADSYRAYFRENLRPAKGIRIDVITQDHFNDFDDNHVNQGVVESQNKVRLHLEAMDYDIAMGEGFKAGEISQENILRDMYELASRKRGADVRQTLLKRGVDLTSFDSFSNSPGIRALSAASSSRDDIDAVYQYSMANPGKGYGAEDGLFIELHHVVLEQTWGQRMLDGRTEYLIATVAPIASKIRAEFSIAKAVETLRAKDMHSAVIVYGYAHVDQFRELAKGLGYQCAIYNSVSGQSLPSNR